MPDRPGPSRKEEHIEDTRLALIKAARELFAKKGYNDTGTEEIIQRARVSRGGMYHHFATKEDLFRAVLEHVEEEFIGRLAAAGAPGDTWWEQISNGIQAFLDVSLDPAIQRIMILDGPAVLGWPTWREIEMKHGFGLLIKFLRRAVDAGELEPQPVEPLAHLVAGALNEAAMVIANARDQRAARRAVGASVARMLAGLRASPASIVPAGPPAPGLSRRGS